MAQVIIRNGTPEIVDAWTVDDFQEIADNEFQATLTDAQVLDAMQYLADDYDSTRGINYGLIRDAIAYALRG